MPAPDGPGAFGALLQQYRRAAGLSQDELAERATLSRRGISDLERGVRRAPYPSTTRRLADALDLSATDRASLSGAALSAQPSFEPSIEALPIFTNLPISLTSFVGRQQEVAEVQQLLATARLLTLCGAGGIGKTRLALEVVREVDGDVAFVELASVTDRAALPYAIASILGVREQPQRPLLQTLMTALRPRHLLLVLDNCEHLVSACAELAEELLRSCAHLRILATTREPLGIGGEVVWQVPPLTLPDLGAQPTIAQVTESEAVQLFIDRAQSRVRGFSITPGTAFAVADVCVQVDGIPLAIELAAARVKVLTPEQMAARLSDRFRLLSGGNDRHAPARHQTLRAAVDWSFDLLSVAEQHVLAQLAVFAGGWTLEAAEAVCTCPDDGTGIPAATVLDVLSGLVDKSLVLAEPGARGVRYRFLETIRQYASERMEVLPEADAIRQRHRTWHVELANKALLEYWWGEHLLARLEQLEHEQANFRAALHFSLERGEAQPGLHMAAGIWVLWGFRGSWQEGRDWIERLLALPDAAHPVFARSDALTALGQMAFQQGDYAKATKLLAEAVQIQRHVGDPRGLVMALSFAGLAARGRGKYKEARSLHEEAAAVSRAAGNRGFEAVVLGALAHTVYLDEEYEQATALAGQSLAIVTAGQRGGRGSVDASIPLYVLGRVALCAEDYAGARQHLEETVALWRATGDLRCAPGALVGLGCVALAEGDQARGCQLMAEALAFCDDPGWRVALLYGLEGVAILGAAKAQAEQALLLAGAANALRTAWNQPLPPAENLVLQHWLGPARQVLGERASAAAWSAGQSLSAEGALACARVVCEAAASGRVESGVRELTDLKIRRSG